MGAGGVRTDDSGSSAAGETVLATSATAEAETNPAVEDAVAIRAITLAKWSNVAAAAAAPAPLAAVVGMSITFPTEEADVTVALVSFIGPTPAIASPWSNAIPIDVNCAWRYEDIAEKASLVVKKSRSALRVFITQLKDIKACVDDAR